MLQHSDHHDEADLDAAALDPMACETQYWMRFFATLRMTANYG